MDYYTFHRDISQCLVVYSRKKENPNDVYIATRYCFVAGLDYDHTEREAVFQNAHTKIDENVITRQAESTIFKTRC